MKTTSQMKAFFGDAKLKADMVDQLRWHQDQWSAAVSAARIRQAEKLLELLAQSPIPVTQ